MTVTACGSTQGGGTLRTEQTKTVASTAGRLTPPLKRVRAVCRADLESAGGMVLCPERLPAVHASDVQVGRSNLAGDPCGYLINIQDFAVAAKNAYPYHVLAGGECREWSLATAAGAWPAEVTGPGYLALVSEAPRKPGDDRQRLVRPSVVREITVRGQPGLLLQVRPYPVGGLHGGHYAVAWNEGGRGYALSMHYPSGTSRRAPVAHQVEQLQATAAAMTAVR